MSNWRTSRAALVLASSAILLLLSGSSADAAYPGHNGQILFHRFQVGGPPGANGSFWEMDPDTGSEHRVTPAAPRDRYPVWSPDGSRFAFTRIKNRSSTFQLMVMDADGSDLRMVGKSPPAPPLRASDVVAGREPDRRERLRGVWDAPLPRDGDLRRADARTEGGVPEGAGDEKSGFRELVVEGTHGVRDECGGDRHDDPDRPTREAIDA